MKIETLKKLVTNLHNKTEYVIHIRNLKQALNRGLTFKKVHRIIKFKQKSRLKSYIDINKTKNYFEKYFFKLMDNVILGKTMENMGKI